MSSSSAVAKQEIAGQDVVVAYGDVGAEYAALRSGALVIDRSHRGRMRFLGEKAGDALTGLTTNDVLALHPGQGQYAAVLSAKGRIVADVRVFASAGSYLVDAPARAFPGFAALIKKYVNPRVSGYRDDSHPIRDLGVFGVEAPRIVSRLTGIAEEALRALSEYAHTETHIDGAPVTVARTPDIGVDGFDLFVAMDAIERIRERALAAGGTPAGLAAWEIARVEAGRPEWGIDMDDSTIPQEANFDDLNAISYTKGCYIGQEVVARVHFRGHVNRHLRGIRAASSEPVPSGAQLIDDNGNHVGEVRSAVSSPRLGGIGIAMLRREITPGMTLTAKWEQGEQRVDVTLLPFPG